MTNEERETRCRGSGFAEAQDSERIRREVERHAVEKLRAEAELKALRHGEEMRAAIQRTTIQPAEWLPYKLRDRMNLFEAACLLCRQQPRRLSSAVHLEYIEHERKVHGSGAAIRVTERDVLRMVSGAPEMMLGDDVGRVLKLLVDATGAPSLNATLDVERLRSLADGLGLGWPPELDSPRAPTHPAPSASAPAVAGQDVGPEFSMLATRERLIQAFGPFTGMDASWFKNLTDTPALLRARRVEGTGGRGHTMEPWFCPFDVMNWLCSSRRKKGRPMRRETGWRMLQQHFPRVYAAHEAEAPDPDWPG